MADQMMGCPACSATMPTGGQCPECHHDDDEACECPYCDEGRHRRHNPADYEDPFTALVEDDAWYAANVEKKESPGAD